MHPAFITNGSGVARTYWGVIGRWLRRFDKTSVYKPTILLQQLEARIVLDAAPAGVDQNDAVDHQDACAIDPGSAGQSQGVATDGDTQVSATQPANDTFQQVLSRNIDDILIGRATGENQNPVTNDGAAGDSLQVPVASSMLDGADELLDAAQSGHDLKVSLISDTIAESEILAAAVKDGVQAIVYDGEHDNLATLLAKLEALAECSGQKIGTLAILDHSASGTAFIGSDRIDFCNLSDHGSQLATLSTILSEDAQIQFFGCSIAEGEEGKALVDRLALMTEADVLASVDPTGGATGDWILEYASDSSIAQDALFTETGVQHVASELSTAWQADLVADINTWTHSSDANNLVDLNGTLFFTCDDGIHGTELWKSDGTEQGTTLVKDIYAGVNGSSPSDLIDIDGTLFFSAYDGSHGTDLWRSDGTEAGTVMVKDINTAAWNAGPSNLTNVNGTLFFSASDESHGTELWKSDGTEAGTVMVKDIITGVSGSSPSNFANVNGTLFFSAYDSVNGKELWKSDGTEAGTVMVKDIYPGARWNSSDPSDLTNVNGTLFFTASDGTHGRELWKSDGTEAGTVMVKDICAGTWSSELANLTKVNGTLFFTAYDPVNGSGLWKSDGTEAGTGMVKDIYPHNLTNVNGTLFFRADDGSHGIELWKSDGTDAGTVMVKDINAATWDASPSNLTNVNGTLFFRAYDGSHGTELWKSDGTSAGTGMVKDIYAGTGSSLPSDLTNVNGTLFFRAYDGSHATELWKSDGTEAGTVMVMDIRDGVNGSSPSNLVNINGTLFFRAYDGSHATELWKSDGTDAGTVMVKDIYAGAGSSSPSDLTNVNGTLFFTANDGSHGKELWKSDGTDAGTVMVKDIYPGPWWDSAGLSDLTNVNGTLFFTTSDGSHGIELWKSDGTETGTVMVRDIYAGTGSSNPYNLTNVDGTLFFRAYDGFHGTALWKTDGTAAGTVMVRAISPSNLTNVNGILLFSAYDSVNGGGLWKTDGTAAGTVMVKDIGPSNLTNVNGTLFFIASDGAHGTELWTSDGTAVGTVMVKDIYVGTGSSGTSNLTNVNGTLFFSASDGYYGIELWKADLYTNAPPVNRVPESELGGVENTPFAFGEGARISVFDPDAGSAAIQVTLTADHGILSLGTTSGLISVVGNGTNNVMLQGAQDVINTALAGLVFTPESGYLGKAAITVLTNDLGATGSGGARTDRDTVTLQIRPASYYAPFIASGEVPTLAVHEGVRSPVFTLTAHDMDFPELTDVNFVIDGQIIPGDTGDGLLADVAVAGGILRPIGYVAHDGNGTYTQQFTFTHPDGQASVGIPYLFKSLMKDGTTDENSNTAALLVAVSNVAPVFSGTIADRSVFEGKTTTVDFTGMFSDVPSDTLTYAYRVDAGDWVDIGTDTSFDLTFSGSNIHVVIVRAMDGDGGVEDSNLVVITPRTIDRTVFEGQTATVDFTGLFTNNPSETFTYAYQMDGGGWVNIGTNTSFNLTYGDDGVHTGVVAATDGNGVTRTENFTVTVNNLAPVFYGGIADRTVFDGQTVSVDFTGMFWDVPSDSLTYAYRVDSGDWVNLGTDTSFSTTITGIGDHQAAVRATDEDGGVRYSNVFTMTACSLGQVVFEGQTATIDFTGLFTAAPPETFTYAYQVDGGQWVSLGTDTSFNLTYGDDGVHTGLVAATDENGLTLTQDFVVTVQNRAPVFSGTIANQTAYAGKTVTVDFTGMFTDVPSDSLTYAYKIADADWVNIGTDTSFSALCDRIGILQAAVRATDDDGGINYSNVFIITTRNLDQTVLEGQTASVNFTGFFTDAPAAAMTYAYQIDGGAWVNLGTNTSFNLTYGDDGIHTGVVAATDRNGLTTTEDFTITVKNQAPIFSGIIPDKTVFDGYTTVTVDFTGMFTDVPADTVTYAYQADGGQWIDLGTGTSFDLTVQELGAHKAAVRATDEDGGLCYSNVFTITWPVLDETINEGQTATIDFTGVFTDVSSGPLTHAYQVDDGAWVQLGTNTSFHLTYGDEGVHPGVVAATDEDGVTHNLDFTVTVNNLPPVFSGNLADRTVYAGQTVTIDFTGMFSDVPGDTLTYSYRLDDGAWVSLGTNTSFCLTFGRSGVHYVAVAATDGDGGVAYSRSYSDTPYIPVVLYHPAYTPPWEPALTYEPHDSGEQQTILSPTLGIIIVTPDEHTVSVDTRRGWTLSLLGTELTGPTEAGFTIFVKSAGSFDSTFGSSGDSTAATSANGATSGGVISGTSSSSSGTSGGLVPGNSSSSNGTSGGVVSGNTSSPNGASSGPISSNSSSSNGTSSGASYEGHPSGSDVSGGWYDDSLSRLMGGWSSLVPGWSIGDTTQGLRNWLSATPAGLLARGWEDARPYEQGVGPDAGPGSSHSGAQASLSEHFSDAVAQAGAVTEDLWWLPGSAAFVAMAEIARRKALTDRKAAMAAEGMVQTDNAADPRAMTFTNADGTKTVEYTLSDAACFTGIGQKYCKYITTELITERTEHKVGDAVEYEYTTREVTNSYHLTYDPEKGFSPVTFGDSVSNAASLDEGWNAVAKSGGGLSDATVAAANKILLDAVETSKVKSPEEAILAITEAKKQAEDVLKKEIEKLEEQKQHLYAIDRWDLTERQMHLLGAKRSMDKLCSEALANELLRKWPWTDMDSFDARTAGHWSALYITVSNEWDMLPNSEDCDLNDPFWEGFWGAYDEGMEDKVVSPNPKDLGHGQFVPVGLTIDPNSPAAQYFRENPSTALPFPGAIAAGVGGRIAPSALKWAQKLGLNVKSATTQQILQNWHLPVRDFIANYRLGNIKSRFPSEFLNMSVREALEKGGSVVRKLLTDGRFMK